MDGAREEGDLEKWIRVNVGVGDTLGVWGALEGFCARGADMTDALKKFFIFQMNLCLPEEGIVWDGQVHTATFKMDNRQGPTLYHRELSSMFCASLDGRGVWGRVATYICMGESIRFSSETTTTVLISCTPIQNKKFNV